MPGHAFVDVIDPRRWGLYASSRQRIVVLTFDTIEDAEAYDAHPEPAVMVGWPVSRMELP